MRPRTIFLHLEVKSSTTVADIKTSLVRHFELLGDTLVQFQTNAPPKVKTSRRKVKPRR